MKLAIRCRHCGTGRNWEKGVDGCIRPECTFGPAGVGHYPYGCAVSPSGHCEPSDAAMRLDRDRTDQMRKRFGIGAKVKR